MKKNSSIIDKITDPTSKKKINRRKFCSCMLTATAGLTSGIWVGCSEEDPSGLNGSLTLSVDQVTQLKSNGYINVGLNDGAMVFYTAPSTYTAYTRNCPHEGGLVTASSGTLSRCGKHTGQTFDISNNAKGNGDKTSANLTRYNAVENSDGTITVSS